MMKTMYPNSDDESFPLRENDEQQKIRALPWLLVNSPLNAIFMLWTFGGSIFLLFLRELGLPKGQIGIILSMFPFCGVLALWFAPVAARWGWKRVYLVCYGFRKGVMALLLLLPWVLASAGQTAGLIFLFVVITLFALLRALAETAYYPWSQEIVPNRLRGRITGITTLLVTLASGVALGIAGWVIGHGTGLPRFLVLIAAGCVAGLLGVISMSKVPGGAPRPEPDAVGVHVANMAEAMRDRNFIFYLGGLGCMTFGTLLFTSFLPLYVKERLGVASGTVVLLDIAVMTGGAVAGMVLGWAADRVGSRPVLMSAAAIALLVPLGWVLLPRHLPHAVVWYTVLYFLNGITAGGVAIASARLLFNSVIPTERSTAYTAIYYAWLGVTGGIAPLLAGCLLSSFGSWQAHAGSVVLDGNTVLFMVASLFLAMGWGLYGRVRPDDRHTTRAVLKQVIKFASPLRGLFPPRMVSILLSSGLCCRGVDGVSAQENVIENQASNGNVKQYVKGGEMNQMNVARHPKILSEVPSQPAGAQWAYQVARAIQLSPTEMGLLANIRLCAIRPVDIEAGNDLVIFDRLDGTGPKATVPLNRAEIGVHPRTGEALLMCRYPLAGGFVPLGACRTDGTSHPHAGTGFAMSHVIGYPVDDVGDVTVYGLWNIPVADRHSMIEVQQYRYDGVHFTVEHSALFETGALLPGWVVTSMPLGNCLADGDDFLGTLVARPAGSDAVAGSGLVRWQRHDGRWHLCGYTPVPGAEGAFEPSLIRDCDGSLLFTVRGGLSFAMEGKQNSESKSCENDIRVWKSEDGGVTWLQILHAPGVRAATPVTINKASNGTVYIAGNPHRDTDSRGEKLPSIEMRESLLLWPLSTDRTQLLVPVLARDCNSDFGVPPFGSIWRADHPVGMTIRLADGQWHHILPYRVLEQSECTSDAPVTAYTGTYVDEVLTQEPVQPEWCFTER